MEYTLIRSNRKTLAVRILPGGKIEVRAPARLSKKQIEAFLKSKERWIAEKCAQSPEPISKIAPGTLLPFLGEEYALCLKENIQTGIQGSLFNVSLPPSADESMVHAALQSFYRVQAYNILPGLVKTFSEKLQVHCEGIRITSAKTRWGSCSQKHRINFSWRLMAAPIECIELVVAHELCHILHFDHSPAFYQELAAIMPDWKERAQRLKDFRQLQW